MKKLLLLSLLALTSITFSFMQPIHFDGQPFYLEQKGNLYTRTPLPATVDPEAAGGVIGVSDISVLSSAAGQAGLRLGVRDKLGNFFITGSSGPSASFLPTDEATRRLAVSQTLPENFSVNTVKVVDVNGLHLGALVGIDAPSGKILSAKETQARLYGVTSR